MWRRGRGQCLTNLPSSGCFEQLLCCRWALLNAQVFHGHCQHCDAVSRGELPKTAPSGQMGPRLMTHIISVLSLGIPSEYPKSKIASSVRRHLLCRAISEAQGRISSHWRWPSCAQKAYLSAKVMPDETSHQHNGESNTRWLWLMASSDGYSKTFIVPVARQCQAPAGWGQSWGGGHRPVRQLQLAGSTRHQFCLASCSTQSARDGGILWQWTNGLPLVVGSLLFKSVFHPAWLRGWTARWAIVVQANAAITTRSIRVLLTKGLRGYQPDVTPDAASIFSSMKPGCGCFYSTGERRWPIMRRGALYPRQRDHAKDLFGTTSDKGEKFRSRVLSVIETCKKRSLSAIGWLTQ